MKLQIREHTTTIKDSDIDLPIYLYFQDEDCMDELISYDGKKKITITHNFFGFTIDVSTHSFTLEEYQLKYLTTKEHFEEELEHAKKNL